jgi:hypothetical protein
MSIKDRIYTNLHIYLFSELPVNCPGGTTGLMHDQSEDLGNVIQDNNPTIKSEYVKCVSKVNLTISDGIMTDIPLVYWKQWYTPVIC